MQAQTNSKTSLSEIAWFRQLYLWLYLVCIGHSGLTTGSLRSNKQRGRRFRIRCFLLKGEDLFAALFPKRKLQESKRRRTRQHEHLRRVFLLRPLVARFGDSTPELLALNVDA